MKLSFKYRFILSFVTIEILFISLIVVFNFSSFSKLSFSLIEEKIETGSTLFGELVKTPLSVYDLGTIDNAVDSFVRLRNVRRVRVTDPTGRVVSEGSDPSLNGMQIPYDTTAAFTQDDRTFRWTSFPVTAEGIDIGRVDILFELTESLKSISETKRGTYILIAIEILISTLVSFFIGYRLSDNLNRLTAVARKIDRGEAVDFSAIKSASSEIMVLTGSLAHMYEQIVERDTYLKERIKEALEANEKQQQLLLRQSRFAAMGEMIVMIAHQWRQPLTTLSMLIQNLEISYHFGELDETTLSEATRKSMEQIRFMSRTIDDFMDLHKPHKAPQPFNLADIVNTGLEISRSTLLSRGIDLYTEGLEAHGSLMLSGFPNELTQVIINLLNNAKDAVSDRYPVQTDHERWIKVSVEEEATHIALTVEDNGGGIDEAIMEQIFEPYFTTKGEVQGTGIGLYLSKILVEQNMAGSLKAANGDEGARFTITLPKPSPAA